MHQWFPFRSLVIGYLSPYPFYCFVVLFSLVYIKSVCSMPAKQVKNSLLSHILRRSARLRYREYFIYRDGHGLGCLAIHLAHHCFSFNMKFDCFT